MFIVDQRLGNFVRIDHEASFLTLHPSHESWARSFPEAAEIQWTCETFGDPEAVAVDVGAHCGTWTVALARAFERVVAFEPNRLVYWNLCANLALKRCLNVTPVEQAVSSTSSDRVTYLVRSEDGGGNGIERFAKDGAARSLEVAAITLDAWFEQHQPEARVALVKVDVEGHERHVLEGARRLVRRCRPALILESWEPFRETSEQVPARALRKELLAFLHDSLDYEVRGITCNAGMFLATPRG